MHKITQIRRSPKVVLALAIIGAVLLVVGYVNDAFSFADNVNRVFGRGGESITEKDINELQRACQQSPQYLADLPDTTKETLRAAYEEGRRLQEEGCEARQAETYQEAIDKWSRALGLAEDDEQRAALHLLRGRSYYSISQTKKLRQTIRAPFC